MPIYPDTFGNMRRAIRASTAVIARLQNIASAMRVGGFANGGVSNGTDTAGNSVKWAVNDSGVDAPAPAPMFPGWYMDTDANGVEVNVSGPLTVTASIEYPIGTRTACTFGGATAGTVPPGGLLIADDTSVTVPAGAFFATHTYVTCAAGVKWPTMDASTRFGGGKDDLAESGTAGTLADKTMTGAPTTTTRGYMPVGVRSKVASTRPVLGAMGDSTLNAGDGLYDANNNTVWFARAASGKAPVFMSSITGTWAQASAASGKVSKRIALMQALGVTHCCITYSSNDFAGGRTLAQVQADVLAIANQVSAAGIKPIGWTIIPRSTPSADLQQSNAGQKAGTGAFIPGTSSLRHQYNEWMRSKPAPFVDYFEGADALDVDASGVPTRGGGYWITGDVPGGNPHMIPRTAGAVTGSPTTTSVPTNITGKTAIFAAGSQMRLLFTSGALAGTVGIVTAYATDGTCTISPALSSAPAAGDTVMLSNKQSAATDDAVHPNKANSASLGGQDILKDMASAKIAALA